MLSFIIVLIVLVSLLLILVVLAQNSKGGGLSSTFGGGNQIIGVKRTTDLLEKLTWGFAIGIFCLTLAASYIVQTDNSSTEFKSANFSEESAVDQEPPSLDIDEELPTEVENESPIESTGQEVIESNEQPVDQAE